MNVIFFDLETQHTFDELGLNRKNPTNLTKLKLAVAGVLTNGKHMFFYENEVDELFKTLGQADTIVGHNLFRFDYLVLKPYFNFDIQRSLRARTFDIMHELDKKTGCWIGLNELCRINLGITKTENPLEIPKMWRDGKHAEVQEYLLNDLKMIEGILNHGKKFGKIKYDHKEYGVSMGMKEVNVEW